MVSSATDPKYSTILEKQAEEIDYWIVKKRVVLIFGAEKNCNSLSTAVS